VSRGDRPPEVNEATVPIAMGPHGMVRLHWYIVTLGCPSETGILCYCIMWKAGCDRRGPCMLYLSVANKNMPDDIFQIP
jgi:hypothetical protein